MSPGSYGKATAAKEQTAYWVTFSVWRIRYAGSENLNEGPGTTVISLGKRQ